MRDRLALPRRPASIAVISIALTMLAARSPARAQSAEAEALFNDGIKLMGEGKVAQACAAFYASNRVESRAGTLIHLGECRERNQQLASAWSAYKDALARVKDPRKREVATAKVAALEPRLSYLTVSFSDESRVEGLTLMRNGQPFDPMLWNRALPVDGGDYIITGRAPGREDWQIMVHIATEGTKISVKVPRFKELNKLALQRPSLPTSSGSHDASFTTQAHEVTQNKLEEGTQAKHAPPAPSTLEVGQSPHKLVEERLWAAWKPWALVGTGAGIVAVGGVLRVLATRNFNAFDNEFLNLPCANTAGCKEQDINSHLNSLLSQARMEQKISIGSFVVGGTSIIAGVVLLYLNRTRRIEREEMNPNAPGVAMVPVVSHDMVGAVVTVNH